MCGYLNLNKYRKKQEESNNINNSNEVKSTYSIPSSGGQEAIWAPFFIAVLPIV